MRLLFTLLFVGLFLIPSSAKNKIGTLEKNKIDLLLEKQVAAWNEGNLEEFMETYWKSEELTFVGSCGPTYGWDSTLASYKKGYPDKEAMGKLKFTVLKTSKIDRKTILVIGKFELTREIGDLSGHYTLLIQKINGKWLIVSDHSSSAN
jgi:hypothetical protein